MKSSLLLLSLFVFPGLSAQKGNIILSKWINGGIDKKADYQPVKKTGLYFYLSNDNDNIYFNIKVNDPSVQNKILEEGLTVWINMDGKPLKKMGVRYPIGSQNRGGSNKPGHSENITNQENSSATPLSMANTIELTGFTNETERRFPSENPDNFRGYVRSDTTGILFYKMIMPIARLPVRNSKDGNGAMPFTIGIEYGFPADMNKPGSKMNPAVGSELHWIKDIKLATSK